MEQCSPLGWIYYPEEDEMGELKRFLVQTTMELEATILAAHEEISRKEEELTHMRDLLMVAVKERDEAHYKCQKLLVDKNSLQQQLKLQHKLQKAVSFSRIVTKNEEKPCDLAPKDTKSNSGSFVSSDSDESIVSEQINSKFSTPSSSPLSSSLPPNLAATLGKQRPLPEKGKLLQAVMEAGPLLQTLLLAGPLPQWQHPPPQLDRIDIPLVTIPFSPVHPTLSIACNKRGIHNLDVSNSSSNNSSKYQRVV
ncbi:hypothetical protein V2J09_022818 [Rumex salicifolius]